LRRRHRRYRAGAGLASALRHEPNSTAAQQLSLLLISLLPLSALLVGLYRLLALRFHWFDTPNERSSHSVATPRGGGIVFAGLITAVTPLLVSNTAAIASVALVGCVALVGWCDDLRGISARYRFGLYWLLAMALMFTSGLVPSSGWSVPMLCGAIVCSLALLWLTNLYNFMDGINGIAGVEAIFVFGSVLWLGADTPFSEHFGPVIWAAALTVAGFLLWNFPSGKLFMGDAGSAYLGALLGLFILWSAENGGP